MFQFTPFPSAHYGFMYRCAPIAVRGFPHSEICGSSDICSSPQLIAACHVLLRLPVPRHPPYALSYLTKQVPDIALSGLFHFVKKLQWIFLVFSVEIVVFTLRNLNCLVRFLLPYQTVNTRFRFRFLLYTKFYSVFNVQTDLHKIIASEIKQSP